MIVGIIPARYGSTRFPGKPLANIAGMSIIERIYKQSKQAKHLAKVTVATDDKRIEEHVRKFGGEVVLTSTEHHTGTDRCFEALGKIEGNYKYVINIQGDEPFIDPAQIDELAALLQDENAEIATLIMPIDTDYALFNPAEAKVVLNRKNEALYFSRQAIPYLQGTESAEWFRNFNYYYHVGIYAYRTDILEKISKLPVSLLEQAEKLEQLRWLENGFIIKCGITNIKTYAIDRPEDIERILKLKNLS